MGGGIRVGRILGFEINIDWSWLIVFFLVVYTLARGFFPVAYPGFTTTTSWALGLIAAALLFVSVLIHELSHSVVARRFGTPVKGITLFLFGGVSQTSDEPRSAREEFWMAIVGPLTSFGIAIVFYGIGLAAVNLQWPVPVIALVGYLAWINGLLGVFNLVPGFPLDGGRVLRSIIWGATGNLKRATQLASYAGQGFGFVLIAFGLTRILAGDAIGGIWLIFIGWFLTGAARSSYQQVLIRDALSGVRVEQVMTTDVPMIPADLSVRQFVDEHLLKHEYSCYPVVEPGTDNVTGVIGAEEIRTVPSSDWSTARVGQISHKIDNGYKVTADEDAWHAVAKLSSPEVCRLLVMENEHLRGTIGRDAVYRLVETKMRLAA
jgi:Zn-dependent protease/CBS domain-containing protein